jgi:4-amino-4-deoxy-L-arabinose transferase-like glycosyltransferase
VEPDSHDANASDPDQRNRFSWTRAAWFEALVIAAVVLPLNLAGNARTSLWDRDEPRYAGCAREMRVSGDYIHPTFNAKGRYHKPILTYWLMQLGVAVGGDNPLGNRLVSSVMGVGTCLLVWGLGRRMFGANVGRLAALVMATAPIVVAESKLATTDATLLFFLTLAQWAVWELMHGSSARWAATFWVAMAFATLTKGPIGPVLIGASGLMAWACRCPPTLLRHLRWGWGVPLYLVITAPWFMAIGIITQGEFFDVAMGRHVLHRMTTEMETHGGFPGYYVAGSILGFYPWSAFLPAALVFAWKSRAEGRTAGFLAGWVLGPLLLLELVRTKLIHYYLPAYAGCALLAAWFLDAVIASESNIRRWPLGRLAVALLVGVGVGVAVVLGAGAFVVPRTLRLPALALVAVITVGTLAAVEPMLRNATRAGIHRLGVTWAAVLVLACAWAIPALEPYRLTPKAAARLADLCAREGATPILGSFQPPGMVYEFGRPIAVRQDLNWLARLVADKGTIAAALTRSEAHALADDPRWTVEVRETVEGINVERARNERLQMALIRPRALDSTSVATQPRGDQQTK